MLLTISIIILILNITIVLTVLLNKKTKISYMFIVLCITSILGIFGLIMQQLTTTMFFNNYSKYLFEPLLYLSTDSFAFTFYLIVRQFTNKSFDYKKYLWVYVFPILAIIMLVTNDAHHLFFEQYSNSFSEIKMGTFYEAMSSVEFVFMGLCLLHLLLGSIKNFRRFSKQMLTLFVTSCLLVLILQMFSKSILLTDIYMTPFICSMICMVIYFTIIKYKYISNIPIDLQYALDSITTPLVIITNDGKILKCNKEYKVICAEYPNMVDSLLNFYTFLKIIDKKTNIKKITEYINSARLKNKSIAFTKNFLKDKKEIITEVSLTPLAFSDKQWGTLIILKDITSYNLETKEIVQQEHIIELQSQFATLGELAAGVAHDINTPITSIKTALSILKTNDLSTTDLEVIEQMDNSANKIIELSTNIRNQFRNMKLSNNEPFNLTDIIISIDALTKNEFARNNCALTIDISENISIYGVPAKLSQVLLNIIKNALTAYTNVPCEDNKKHKIILKSYLEKNIAYIEITDFAGGIPPDIAPYIFDNILTTKGSKGFGLGLYVSASIIRNDFSGTISFDDSVPLATTFKMSIPVRD
ncbi:MAG: histidine kinase N-terminal 7TM domain-containing protein [Clostridia bacterium]